MQSAKKVNLLRFMKVMKHSFLVECALGNFESAKEAKSIYEELLNIVNGVKDNDLKESNLLMEGCLHLVKGRLKEAIDLFEKLYYFQQNKPEKYVETCPEEFYDVLFPEGLLSEQDQLESLQNSPKVADNLIVFNLSIAYGRNDEHQKAIDLLEKTIPLWKTHGEDLSLARAYFYLGNLYSHLKNDHTAEKMFSLSLDFYKYARWYHQAVERFHRPRCRLIDVDQPFMRPHLKLFPRFLIDMRRTQNGVSLDSSRKWNRPANPCIRAFGMVHDLSRRCVQRPWVVSLHPNPNPFTLHIRLNNLPIYFLKTFKNF
jgi:tetratricopeptide (TPR) repeat protein